MSLALTGRQEEVLDMIRSFIAEHGYPPTRAEIAALMGCKSPLAAELTVLALAKKGALIITKGVARGIRVAAPAKVA